jgi:hypothetical protein
VNSGADSLMLLFLSKRTQAARCQTLPVGPRVELTTFLHFFTNFPAACISFNMLHDAKYLADYSILSRGSFMISFRGECKLSENFAGTLDGAHGRVLSCS